MFKRTKTFIPANNTEYILIHLPKQCSCSACTATKKSAQIELGEKRYKKVCRALGLAA